MRQILLHSGFHKTATSSMQHFLWLNRETLEPYFDLRMFRHMKPVVRLAAMYSRTRNPLDLVDMVGLLDDVFDEFPVREDRDLLISCEGLSGHFPAAQQVKDYSAVPVLMTYVAGYLVEKFPDAQVKLIFTTRQEDSWLYSVYRHHLRAHRMTLDYKSFAATFKSAARLDAVIREVAEILAPLPVMFLPMEDAVQHPLGPGAMTDKAKSAGRLSVRPTFTPRELMTDTPDLAGAWTRAVVQAWCCAQMCLRPRSMMRAQVQRA